MRPERPFSAQCALSAPQAPVVSPINDQVAPCCSYVLTVFRGNKRPSVNFSMHAKEGLLKVIHKPQCVCVPPTATAPEDKQENS